MPTLLKAKGLNTYNNELNLPAGSLIIADNVVIDKNDSIEPRRGMAKYGDELPETEDRIKQFLIYKDRILRHFGTTIQYDDGEGVFTNFSGEFNELEDGLRLKYVESNGNLYFTTSDGIKKISALDASQFNSDANFITNAGAPKGLDLRGTLTSQVGGFFTTDSQVAYRVVWGIKDNNNILILGSPSERVVLINPSTGSDSIITLTSTVPADILSSEYFYQVYRSLLSSTDATVPDDELNLVYEEGVTSTDISNGYVTITDSTPEDFRVSGAPLYTNPISGDGILQANDKPPIAKDITNFKESTFYGNTKTIQRRQLTLLGVGDFTAGLSKFIISNDSGSVTYNFEAAEDVALRNVLLSTSLSAAESIDETARSLVHIINRDSSGLVYAYYLSGPDDLPGIMLFESRNLLDSEFYIGVTDAIGTNFNPTLSESVHFHSLSQGLNPIVATSVPHGYTSGDNIYIDCQNSVPTINGVYEITVVNSTGFQFTADEIVTISGSGFCYKGDIYSDNEEKPNRLYFSKTSQPEAVPLLNYIDIGSKDQQIKRIIALRDNLFVLKEDGVFIVSGSSAPNFSQSLLDRNSNISAPDSAAVLNNSIYCLATQGVVEINDGGSGVISYNIEDRILAVTNSKFVNSSSLAYGFNYDSDRAYFINLPTLSGDTTATQSYRFNHFTRSWTRFDLSSTCGIVNPADDKMYLGDADNNFIRQERKNYDRSDYADLDYDINIATNGIIDDTIQVDVSSNITVGDVIVQEQYITHSRFNRLLKKLDLDSGLDTDYFSTQEMVIGDDLYTSLNQLMIKLNADDSGIEYISINPGTFYEANIDWDTIIDNLNNTLSDSFFNDYQKITLTTPFEAIITSINRTTNITTVSVELPFFPGPITSYKGFISEIQWAPQDFGDPSVMKQVSAGTIIFNEAKFYGAELSYSTDLSGSFDTIPFLMYGTGTYGTGTYGDVSWGGPTGDVPFRALVPRQKQRCRYITAKFLHFNARETFEILGISLDMRALSTKAYK